MKDMRMMMKTMMWKER